MNLMARSARPSLPSELRGTHISQGLQNLSDGGQGRIPPRTQAVADNFLALHDLARIFEVLPESGFLRVVGLYN